MLHHQKMSAKPTTSCLSTISILFQAVSLLKSLNKFEDSCKALSKDLVKENLPQSSKVRMAALVIEKLSTLSEKKDEKWEG